MCKTISYSIFLSRGYVYLLVPKQHFVTMWIEYMFLDGYKDICHKIYIVMFSVLLYYNSKYWRS